MQEAQVKYYKKDIPEMPVYVNGTPLRFEVLETADALLIGELDKCIATQRGGIIAIPKEEYDEAVKKKPQGINSDSVFKQSRQRQELSALQFQNLAAAEAGVRVGGMFARPQERAHTPHNKNGLPNGVAGPAGSRPMPDPIQVPDRSQIQSVKPPTAKLSDLK